ncbi:hypothetical protein LSM04_007011 [Trypanosoma melophagium]|uniref:uncharacterized protein n=1 Tax=Trypanosoma melophagium TaxID=715481 RepID=UPI00351A4C26|nr:hypothetical protein LSM04_007011 [Trypanosoma melophagium]
MSHLFAICKDAVCVAEDTCVAFYAPKNLKKFRVERLSGRRIAGLYIVKAAKGEMHLHVIDAEANWFLISLSKVELLSSSSIKMVNESTVTTGNKPIVSARRGFTVNKNLINEHGILEAHFHEAGGELHCVLLTMGGVYEASLRDTAVISAEYIITFRTSLRDCTMVTGRSTGLVLVGQRGEKWAQYSLYGEREKQNCRQLLLPIQMQSMACNPITNSVAVGGIRGELIIYPSVTDDHHFSDHWHHTPLTALSFSVDGNSLYSAARESIMLVWNLSSYTFRKIGCSLGLVRSIVPSCSNGSQLLMACAESTLATLDLLQMRVEKSIDGVQWSTSEACSGLVVGNWMGQTAVVLTGLPNVVRICDPFSQQALYSLHISSQMETIPAPPRHGIQHVGFFNGNRTIVTYEEFRGTTLPPLLRFWVYDASVKRHVESQTIYSPHCSRILALQTDNVHGRVFTLSANSMKCWGEAKEDVNNAYATATEQKGWINKSSSSTPSRLVHDLILSQDASLCLVSDDNIHIYSTANLRPGEKWHRVITLTQSTCLSPLRDLQLLNESRTVVARDEAHVYFWSLNAPHQSAIVWETKKHSISALCSYGATSVLIATDDGSLSELCGSSDKMGKELGHASSVTPHRITLLKSLPGPDKERVAVVDDVSGFRVLHISLKKNKQQQGEEEKHAAKVEVVNFNGVSKHVVSQQDDEKSLQHFFHDVYRIAKRGNKFKNNHIGERDNDGDKNEDYDDDDNNNEESFSLNNAVRAAAAKKWLAGVLADSAYTAPPMSCVLSLYLKKRAGIPTL